MKFGVKKLETLLYHTQKCVAIFWTV